MSARIQNFDELEAFAGDAQSFCAFIESFQDGRPRKLYETLELLIARLHIGVLSVVAQTNERDNPELESSEEMGFEQWREIGLMIQDIVSDDTSALVAHHIQISNGKLDDDAIRADMLWDDLADMYRDLRCGLRLWDMGTVESRIEASWAWRYNYEIHWGHHLARAMQSVHEIRYRLNED